MRPLLIDDTIQAHIDAACARAKLHPIVLTAAEQKKLVAFREPLGTALGKTLLLADRPKDWQRLGASEAVLIPFGFYAAISYEQQPAPLGLCVHLSVSVDSVGKVPTPHAMAMLAVAFGFKGNRPRNQWLEEIEPGHHAVNIVEPCEWPPEEMEEDNG